MDKDNTIREGHVKKGGQNPVPETPKPDMTPPSQKKESSAIIYEPLEEVIRQIHRKLARIEDNQYSFSKQLDELPETSIKSLKLTEERDAHLEEILDAIPECPVHGNCIPHALEWIEKAKEALKNA